MCRIFHNQCSKEKTASFNLSNLKVTAQSRCFCKQGLRPCSKLRHFSKDMPKKQRLISCFAKFSPWWCVHDFLTQKSSRKFHFWKQGHKDKSLKQPNLGLVPRSVIYYDESLFNRLLTMSTSDVVFSLFLGFWVILTLLTICLGLNKDILSNQAFDIAITEVSVKRLVLV